MAPKQNPEQQYQEYIGEVITRNTSRRENPKSYRTLDVSAPQYSELAEMGRQVRSINKANAKANGKEPGTVSYSENETPPWEQDVAPWDQETPPWGTDISSQNPQYNVTSSPRTGTPIYQSGDRSYTASELPGLALQGAKDLLTPRTTMEDVLTPSYLGNIALGGGAGFALGGPAGAVVGGMGAILAHEGYKREVDKWKSMGYTTPGEAEWRAGVSSGVLGGVDMLGGTGVVPPKYSGPKGFADAHMPPVEPPTPPVGSTTRDLFPVGESTPLPPAQTTPRPPVVDPLTPPSAIQNTQQTLPLYPTPLAPKTTATFPGGLPEPLTPVQPPMAPPLELAARAQGKTIVPPTPQEVTRASRDLFPQPEPVLGTSTPAQTGPKWKRWWEEQVRFRFGMDRHVVNRVPDSPVITAVEAPPVMNEHALQTLIEDTPWVQKVLHSKDYNKLNQWLSRKKVREEDETWLDAEARAVKIWKDGGKTQGAYDAAVKSLPPEFQEKIHYDNLLFEQSNAILKKWDLPEIPRLEGPYFTHRTTQEYKHFRTTQARGGMGVDLGMAGRRQERTYETQREGEAQLGRTAYMSPRSAWLTKVYQDLNLKHWDMVMTDLMERGVVHKTREAALASSPTGEPMRVTLGQFGDFWVRTREEAQFLRQNLQPSADIGHFTRLANTYFRGPNLIIPYPHIVKNMGEKLFLTTVANDKRVQDLSKYLLAYKHQTEPSLLKEFEKVYPMSKSGQPASQLIAEAIPQGVGDRVESALDQMNKLSRREIFAKWDPAMRYAVWRGYVDKGMSYQEAANHTFLDLVRYGRRGDVEDFWKSLPMNMFIPWRVGVLSTLNKAFQKSPYKTLGVLGAIETLREWDYRENGRFVHLPHDYLMRPTIHAMSGRYGDALETLVATAMAGPGGEQALRSIETIMKDMQGKGQGADIGKLLWGMKQVYDIGTTYEDFMRTGDVKPVVDLFGLLLMGRHAVPYGAPPRLGQFIPESVMPKSGAVTQAERKGRVARGEEPRGTGLPKMGLPR